MKKFVLFLMVILFPNLVLAQNPTTSEFNTEKISKESIRRIFSTHHQGADFLIQSFLNNNLLNYSPQKDFFYLNKNKFLEPLYQKEYKKIYLLTYMKRIFDYLWNVPISEEYSYFTPRFIDYKQIEKSIKKEDTPLISSSAISFACTSYLIGAEYGWTSVDQTITRLKKICTFFHDLPQEGLHEGFIASVYNLETKKPAKSSHFSILDTANIVIGFMAVKQYLLDKKRSYNEKVYQYNALIATYSQKKFSQKKIRNLTLSVNRLTRLIDMINETTEMINTIYERVNWQSAIHQSFLIKGWNIKHEPIINTLTNKVSIYDSFDGSYLAYITAIGSKTFPISEKIWEKLQRKTEKLPIKNHQKDTLLGGYLPLSSHTYPLCYIDLRDYTYKDSIEYIPNNIHRKLKYTKLKFTDILGWQYFENASKAIGFNQQYVQKLANEFPEKYTTYAIYWGLSNSWSSETIYDTLHPLKKSFPKGSRVSPTATISTIIFNEDEVHKQLERVFNHQHFPENLPFEVLTDYGFVSSFTLSSPIGERESIAQRIDTLEKGAEFLSLENHFTGFVWKLISRDKNINISLKKLGFPIFLLAKTLNDFDKSRRLQKPNLISTILKEESSNLFKHAIQLEGMEYSDYYEIQISSTSDFRNFESYPPLELNKLGYAFLPDFLKAGSYHLRARAIQTKEPLQPNTSYTNAYSEDCKSLWSLPINIKILANPSEPSLSPEDVYLKDIVTTLENIDDKTFLLKKAQRYLTLMEKYNKILSDPDREKKYKNHPLIKENLSPLELLRKKHPKGLLKLEAYIETYRKLQNSSNESLLLEKPSFFQENSSIVYMKNLLEKLIDLNIEKKFITRAQHYILLLKKYSLILCTPSEKLSLFERTQKRLMEKNNHDPLSFLRKKFPKRLEALEQKAFYI
ncbi:hypothetical protein AB834_04260 [PVC group bacterium (ex Bugula neritina AB1)]|nr:hypothetical protein AB834_04260 [PVC group bacterium (ex Bugula neritina AB1)]